jgi:hypothetical protein
MLSCDGLTNDVLLAPTAEASAHLDACEACRERQREVTLAVRALRAMPLEEPVPDANDAAIRAAIPGLALAAGRRQPSSWWSVAAAAALVLAGVWAGVRFSGGTSSDAIRPEERVTDRGEPDGAGKRTTDPGSRTTDPGSRTSDPGSRTPDPGPQTPDPRPKPPDLGTKPPDPIPQPPDPAPADPDRPPGGTGPTARGPVPEPPPDDTTGGRVLPPPDPDPKPPGPLPVRPREVTAADCLRIMKGIVGEAEPATCDLNGDGVTDAVDALIAAKRIAGKRKDD